MPLTPLLPADGSSITFQQGDTRDCYLLASLDCILRTHEGFERIQSMFKRVDGGLEVRIRRCAESAYLERKKATGALAGKYMHYHDKKTDEDVFVLTNARLSEIDSSSEVRSNSLALKILERICSYYYVGDWHSDSPVAGAGAGGALAPDLTGSIAAHNISARHETTSTAFMGNLLGITTQDLGFTYLDQIIQLKKLRPDYPIYISITHGTPDAHGRVGRHGFRLDRIVESTAAGAGGYDFILVNPWDNTTTERHNYTDIQRRSPRFAIYHTPLLGLKTELQAAIISDPSLFRDIISQPELLALIINIAGLSTDLTKKNIQNCVYVYRKVPSLPRQFVEATPATQREMIDVIKTYDGDVSYFTAPIAPSPARAAGGAGAGAGAGVSSSDGTQSISLEARITSAARAKLSTSTTATLEQLHTKIIHGIATYYFDSNPGHLTRESDLRALFSNPHFSGYIPTEIIPSKLPESALVIAAIELHTTDKARRYLETSRFIIREGFVDQFILSLNIKEPRPLFNQIFQLSLINPRLAQELFQSSKARLSSLFPREPFNNLKATIIREAESPFKTWFLNQETVAPAAAAATPPIAPSAPLAGTMTPIITPPPHLGAATSPIAPVAHPGAATPPIAATTLSATTKKERYKSAMAHHLGAIEQKITSLKAKKDHVASEAFTAMVSEIKAAQVAFEKSPSNATAEAEKTFIQQCSHAISNALPILENRGAQRIFVPIVEAILSLATLLRIITPEVKKQSLFQIKTNSAQRVLELKEALLRIHEPSEEENPTPRQMPN
jgi:hypothetical protein